MIKSNKLKTTDLFSIKHPARLSFPGIYLLRKRFSIVEFETIILSYDFSRETGWQSSKIPLTLGVREILMAYVINYIRNIESARTITYNSSTLSERKIISINLTINQRLESAITKSLLRIPFSNVITEMDPHERLSRKI